MKITVNYYYPLLQMHRWNNFMYNELLTNDHRIVTLPTNFLLKLLASRSHDIKLMLIVNKYVNGKKKNMKKEHNGLLMSFNVSNNQLKSENFDSLNIFLYMQIVIAFNFNYF
jgi:hypothetical protein